VAGDAVLRVETGAAPGRLIEATTRAATLVLGGGGIWPGRSRSATEAVLSAAAAPVIIVPRRAVTRGMPGLRSGGVVCAVRDERDLAAAGTAACWGRELDLPLTVVHVVSPRRLPVTPLGGPPPTGLLFGDRDQVWAARGMLGELARAVAPSPPPACSAGVLVGPVGVELAHLGADPGCALLVVGPACPSQARWRFRRRTVSYLTRRARCPVLVTPSAEAALAVSTSTTPGRAARHAA